MVLVPFVKQIVPIVDVAGRTIHVDPPPGVCSWYACGIKEARSSRCNVCVRVCALFQKNRQPSEPPKKQTNHTTNRLFFFFKKKGLLDLAYRKEERVVVRGALPPQSQFSAMQTKERETNARARKRRKVAVKRPSKGSGDGEGEGGGNDGQGENIV